MIRLLKPADYYQKKYGSKGFALGKLYLMMEKQHNRGQEGAGIACVNMQQEPGCEYMFRERALGKDAITQIFDEAYKKGMDEGCELYMGHLRYSTTGKGGMQYVHPFLRRNNWRAKNLCLCGNFNMTNIDEVFQSLAEQGQSPRIYSDSYILLELMGHRLDREVERNFLKAKELGLEGRAITQYIDNHVDVSNVLRTTMPRFDGGYVMCGMTGSGEMFSMRDPWGIRTAFYYANDEFVAIASERPVLQTTFDLQQDDITEFRPGQALIINRAGKLSLQQIIDPAGIIKPCSFERIYFSRGNDADIHHERKQLGLQLCDAIAKAVDGDVRNTVFSYIPNTAEVAYYGMTQGMRQLDPEVRTEKIVAKDIKLRTFITESSSRNDLAAHVYDVTYGVVRPGVDNLVVIDDSIVRGTTLRESIIKILDRLRPKSIVIVSSAPQIRYPDFYGIDMSRIGDFIAFQACIALLRDQGMQAVVDDVYSACKQLLETATTEASSTSGNDMAVDFPLRRLYEPFTADELNDKMVELLRPKGLTTPIRLVFQSIEGLHAACPNHPGDWYFTGHYPTPGGYRLAAQSFISWFENNR